MNDSIVVIFIKYISAFTLSFLTVLCILAIAENKNRLKNIFLSLSYVFIVLGIIFIDKRLVGPLVMSQLIAWLLILIKIIFINKKTL